MTKDCPKQVADDENTPIETTSTTEVPSGEAMAEMQGRPLQGENATQPKSNHMNKLRAARKNPRDSTPAVFQPFSWIAAPRDYAEFEHQIVSAMQQRPRGGRLIDHAAVPHSSRYLSPYGTGCLYDRHRQWVTAAMEEMLEWHRAVSSGPSDGSELRRDDIEDAERSAILVSYLAGFYLNYFRSLLPEDGLGADVEYESKTAGGSYGDL